MTDASLARSDGPILTATRECRTRPQVPSNGVPVWMPGMSTTARVLLAITSYVAAILTALFAVATVFALVTFGAIIWWQPLSAIVFGGVWFGLSRLRVKLTIERSR